MLWFHCSKQGAALLAMTCCQLLRTFNCRLLLRRL